MQSRVDDIKALTDILKLAKLTFCKDDNFDRTRHKQLYRDTLSSFSFIGKEKIYELAPDVYQFVNCENTVLREAAITTLGLSTRLHLPEFKDISYKIWLKDKDNTVRNAALCAWASYYNDTNDPIVLTILYKILIDENYLIKYRLSAMQCMFHVSGERSSFYNPFQSKHFYVVKSHEEFNQKVDWEEIRAIMKKYAPDALL